MKKYIAKWMCYDLRFSATSTVDIPRLSFLMTATSFHHLFQPPCCHHVTQSSSPAALSCARAAPESRHPRSSPPSASSGFRSLNSLLQSLRHDRQQGPSAGARQIEAQCRPRRVVGGRQGLQVPVRSPHETAVRDGQGVHDGG